MPQNYTASLSSVPTSAAASTSPGRDEGGFGRNGGIQFHAAAMANLSGLLQAAAARNAAANAESTTSMG
jgi:hypothetical protein